MHPTGNIYSQGIHQMTLQQQQQYLLQQQMQQYTHQDSYKEEAQNYGFDPNAQMHPSDSYRSGNEFESTPGSKYSVKNARDLTPGGPHTYTSQQEEEDNYEYSKPPKVYSSKHSKNDNFKVIIRVRPPLPREQDKL